MNNGVRQLHLTPQALLAEGFHQQLNAHALAHAPIIYIVHNHGMAGKVPLPLAFANPCLVDLAPAYRLRGARITLEQYENVLKRAEQLCAVGHGPFLIELLLETSYETTNPNTLA